MPSPVDVGVTYSLCGAFVCFHLFQPCSLVGQRNINSYLPFESLKVALELVNKFKREYLYVVCVFKASDELVHSIVPARESCEYIRTQTELSVQTITGKLE